MTVAMPFGHSHCGPPLRLPDAEDPLALALNESPFPPLPDGPRRHGPGRRLSQPLPGIPAGTVPSAHRASISVSRKNRSSSARALPASSCRCYRH